MSEACEHDLEFILVLSKIFEEHLVHDQIQLQIEKAAEFALRRIFLDLNKDIFIYGWQFLQNLFDSLTHLSRYFK